MKVMQSINPHSRLFEEQRHRLYAIAYRMLGSFSDAEDVIQDAYLRWQGVVLRQVDSPAAYLTSIVSRLCIDRLRKAGIEKLSYTGPWLPEPVSDEVTGTLFEPAASSEQAESISIAFLHLLEQLSPMERAVFILKEAFDHDHEQIAHTLDIRLAHSRQLLRRARQKVRRHDPPAQKPDTTLSIMTEFMAAVASGNLDNLKSLMTDDIVAYTDGGGRASAALIPLEGKDRVCTVLVHVSSRQPDTIRSEWRRLNGELALVMWDGDRVHSTHSVQLQGGKVHRLYTMRNPDKLHYV